MTSLGRDHKDDIDHGLQGETCVARASDLVLASERASSSVITRINNFLVLADYNSTCYKVYSARLQHLHIQTTMHALTEQQILQATPAASLSLVRSVNVWGAGIQDITILEKCTHVEILSLR